MTPEIYENIISALNKEQEPLKLSKLRELAKEGGSNWSQAQLNLLFTCIDGIEIDTRTENPDVSLGKRSEQEELIDAIAEIVTANGGKPIHPRKVRRQLPSKFTTSEAQIKALVREASGLEIFGPGLIRSSR